MIGSVTKMQLTLIFFIPLATEPPAGPQAPKRRDNAHEIVHFVSPNNEYENPALLGI